MKYIQVKPAIQIILNGQPWVDAEGTEMPPWSMSRYLENIVLPDQAMGIGHKAIKACQTIGDLFEQANEGDWVPVETEHWDRLRQAVETPKGSGVHSTVLRQLLPFMDAVLEAPDKLPTIEPDDVKEQAE